MTNHAVISHSIVTNIELITLIGNLNSSAKMDFVFVAPTKLLSTHLSFNGWISENPIIWKRLKMFCFSRRHVLYLVAEGWWRIELLPGVLVTGQAGDQGMVITQAGGENRGRRDWPPRHLRSGLMADNNAMFWSKLWSLSGLNFLHLNFYSFIRHIIRGLLTVAL